MIYKRFSIQPITMNISDPVNINLNLKWSWSMSAKGFGEYSQFISQSVYYKLKKLSHSFCIEDEYEKKYLLVVKKIDTEFVISITPMIEEIK